MQFPDRTDSIAFYTDLIRRTRAQQDIVATRGAYAALVESWKQQNANSGGALQRELDTAKREYSQFVRSDPLYLQIRDAVVEIIKQKPGVLQTEMYTALSRFPKTDVQYTLYFASDHGAIVRRRKGRTYELSLPGDASS